MRERPILFKAPMVNAILNGSKTQTRRICKIKDVGGKGFDEYSKDGIEALIRNHCPYGKIGDRLWVREKHRYELFGPGDLIIRYLADNKTNAIQDNGKKIFDHHIDKIRPSIFMHRFASRINLEITNIKVERLNNISEEDAKAEGILPNCLSSVFTDGKWVIPEKSGCPRQDSVGCEDCYGEWVKYHPDDEEYEEPAYSPKESFKSLWESINGPGSWEKNPWLWCVEFKVIT